MKLTTMKINIEQIKDLLALVASCRADEIACEGCYEHMAEFVEHELLGREFPEALKRVERHLDQCPCCNDEHNALLEGLLAITSGNAAVGSQGEQEA